MLLRDNLCLTDQSGQDLPRKIIRILAGLFLSSGGLSYNPLSLPIKLSVEIVRTLLKVYFEERTKPEKGVEKSKFRLSMAGGMGKKGKALGDFFKMM